MDSKDFFRKIQNSINQLKSLSKQSLLCKELTLDIGEKEVQLISNIVYFFDQILCHKLIIKNEKSPKLMGKNNNYWSFISNHFNNPLVQFCRTYDKNELNKLDNGDNLIKKGKIWIFLSILEKSLYDSINEIYKQKFDEKFYEEDSILRKNKTEIIKELKELNLFHFINIKSKDYERFQDFLEINKLTNNENNKTHSSKSIDIHASPIINNKEKNQIIFSHLSDIPLIDLKNSQADNINAINSLNSIDIFKDEKEIIVTKFANFSNKIINNFYTFNNNSILPSGNLNTIIENNIEEKSNESSFSDREQNLRTELILNPKKSNFLPTDNLYEIIEEVEEKDYNKIDKLIYNKIERPISNCLLLYLNKYYKKVEYHKFYKHNLYNRPISLKEQNYQCYICCRRFSLFLNIPTEPICWCSYYMRFVCKNCIDDEYSIIPYFIFKKWCFDKFSISKRAKITLDKWYHKPIIYFKNDDKLINKIKQLNKVIIVKKVINNIFDIMKCKNKIKFVEEALGRYEYLALKEYLFSMRDLVEINNQTFYKKIIEFKDKFVKHISGECEICKYEGEFCNKCGYDEKIYFYDFENVFYCKINRKSYHKKCIRSDHIH